MFDADAVIKKVEEIKACESIVNGFTNYKGFKVIKIVFKDDRGADHMLHFTDRNDNDDNHALDTLDNFIDDELTYYTNQLTKLKQELKDL